MNHYPSGYKVKGSQEAISGENLETFGRMTMNFPGCTFPEHMAGVPFASGEATSLGSLDCRPSPVLSVVYHPERVPHLPPRSTVLDKAHPLSSSYLSLDCESAGGESDSRPLRSPLWPPGKSISTFVDAHWQTCRRLCFWLLISQ